MKSSSRSIILIVLLCLFLSLLIGQSLAESSGNIGWYNKGLQLSKSGHYQEAIDAYNKALETDPNNVNIWIEMGVALNKLGRYQEAINASMNALILDPNNIDAWNNKGTALNYLGQYQEAIDASNKVVSIDPNNEMASKIKGFALEKLTVKPAQIPVLGIIGVISLIIISLIIVFLIVIKKIKLSQKSNTTKLRRSSGTPLIFISFKSEDYEYANKIYRFLTESGYNVFFSQETLPQLGNSDYRKEIDKALDLATHMIVVASSIKNIESPWVEAEWGSFIAEIRAGRKYKVNLITIIIGSIKAENLPISLRSSEVLIFDPTLFQKLLNYLDHLPRQ